MPLFQCTKQRKKKGRFALRPSQCPFSFCRFALRPSQRPFNFRFLKSIKNAFNVLETVKNFPPSAYWIKNACNILEMTQKYH